jgi:glycosyltransferase involved in cell wall biosynthesis
MRVLHAYKVYAPDVIGGIPQVISSLAASMDADIQSRILVCSRDPRQDTEADGALVRVKSWAELLSMPIAPSYPLVLRRAAAKADVVVAHQPFPLTDAGIALGLPAHVALVVHWHSDIIGKRAIRTALAPLMRHTLHRADAIIVSDGSMISTSIFVCSQATKCRIVPFGTDVDYWQDLDDRQRAEVGRLRSAHPRLVVAAGRLVPYKGFESLVRAIRDIDASVVIIGEGPLKSALERLARRLGVGNRLLLTGLLPRDQLKVHLHAARIFAFPSITSQETFGIAQIEAMAVGLPIVNTSLSTGVSKVARHGIEAITVPPNDPPALALAISRLLDDEVLARRFGQAASHRARAEYCWSGFVSRVQRVYREALANRVRAAPASK